MKACTCRHGDNGLCRCNWKTARGATTIEVAALLFIAQTLVRLIGGWVGAQKMDPATAARITEAQVKHCAYAEKNYPALAEKGIIGWQQAVDMTKAACPHKAGGAPKP